MLNSAKLSRMTLGCKCGTLFMGCKINSKNSSRDEEQASIGDFVGDDRDGKRKRVEGNTSANIFKKWEVSSQTL